MTEAETEERVRGLEEASGQVASRIAQVVDDLIASETAKNWASALPVALGLAAVLVAVCQELGVEPPAILSELVLAEKGTGGPDDQLLDLAAALDVADEPAIGHRGLDRVIAEREESRNANQVQAAEIARLTAERDRYREETIELRRQRDAERRNQQAAR